MHADRRLILGLALLLGGAALGQSPPPEAEAARQAHVAAAVDDGIAAIRRDVYATSFSVDLTIRQAAGRIDAAKSLDEAIQSAEQRGGPRWREDGQSCEVRLELPGTTVAAALQEAGVKQFARLGLTSEAFARAVGHLKTLRFAATGVGRPKPAVVERPVDDPAPAWKAVSEPARTEAVSNAKNDAAARVVESLSAVPLGGGRTLADLLAQPGVAGDLRRQLADRPATGVEYGQDLAVRLRLAAGPDEVWPLVQENLQKYNLGPAPDDADAWRRLWDDVARSVCTPTGRGLPPANQRLIPRDPPPWASRQMDADGRGLGTDLKSARTAEALAHAQLRAQVEALELTPGTTLAEAAKRDPRVARALSGALGRARVSRVSYGGPSVTSRVNVDLDWLWRALAAIE